VFGIIFFVCTIAWTIFKTKYKTRATRLPIAGYLKPYLYALNMRNVHQLPTSAKLSIAIIVSLNLETPLVLHSEMAVTILQKTANRTQGKGQNTSS